MDKLIKKIKDILANEKYTFEQLASYLNLTEQELESGLENKTLELRYLEEISKTLKVPLYSFFRNVENPEHHTEKPFFVNKLWKDDEEVSPQKLMEEIELLKQVLEHKQSELNKKNK